MSLAGNLSTFGWLKAYRIPLLVAAVVAVDAFVMGHAVGFNRTLSGLTGQPWLQVRYGGWSRYDSRLDVLILALACSQVSLLTAWACFSHRTRTLRVLTWLSGMGLWIAAIASTRLISWRGASLVELGFAQLLLFQSAAVLVGMSLSGYRIQKKTTSNQLPRRRQTAQFTLEEMFLCFSAAAVLSMTFSWLAWLETLRPPLRNIFADYPQLIWRAGQGIGCGLCGCLAVWACLAEKGMIWRMIVMALAFPAMAWSLVKISLLYQVGGLRLYVYMPNESQQMASWITWFSLQGGLMAAVLLVVRAAAYRMVPGKLDTRFDRAARRLRNCGVLLLAILVAVLLAVWFDDMVSLVKRYQHHARILGDTRDLGVVRPAGGRNYILWIDDIMKPGTVSRLRRYPEINHLHFYEGSLDSRVMQSLGQLPHVREIYASHADISDEDLVHLQELANLSMLHIHGTELSDEGLQHLRPLQQLVELRLTRCAVYDAGRKQLERWLPNTVIYIDP